MKISKNYYHPVHPKVSYKFHIFYIHTYIYILLHIFFTKLIFLSFFLSFFFFTDCRDACILWALHGYFVPNQKIVRKDKTGRKTTTRYTIKDSQDSFVFIARTVQAVEDHIRFLNDRGENVQPFIVVIGEDILTFNEIFVMFDGVKFPMVSFLRATDVCFKLFYVFNLKYPIPSTIFWSFIQCLYFGKSKSLTSKAHILLTSLQI